LIQVVKLELVVGRRSVSTTAAAIIDATGIKAIGP
jgi:hypothetical protein